eukprot:351898-Chlamydomonas_euryale.AAC.4
MYGEKSTLSCLQLLRRWGVRSAAVSRAARLLLGRHVRGREHTIQFAAAQALGREKRGSEPRGTRRTTWLAQCTEPYIDVMDEKSMTLTSPCKAARSTKRGEMRVCVFVMVGREACGGRNFPRP